MQVAAEACWRGRCPARRCCTARISESWSGENARARASSDATLVHPQLNTLPKHGSKTCYCAEAAHHHAKCRRSRPSTAALPCTASGGVISPAENQGPSVDHGNAYSALRDQSPRGWLYIARSCSMPPSPVLGPMMLPPPRRRCSLCMAWWMRCGRPEKSYHRYLYPCANPRD